MSQAALFLDLDGTLAPIMVRPHLVGPDPARNELLRRLTQTLQGRLAIVSGRSIDDIDRIVGGCVACVAGLHGLERRSAAGRREAAMVHPGMASAIEAVDAFAAARSGMLVENKTLAVALHYREAQHAAAEAMAFARGLAGSSGLKLQEGQMVVELRCPGADKGDMVRAFMREPPFAGHVPVFVGDDVTDEDGFAAAQEMEGVGVLVGTRRSTRAIAALSDVSAVLDWLEASLREQSFQFTVAA